TNCVVPWCPVRGLTVVSWLQEWTTGVTVAGVDPP
ncbi:hypothetical protein A2U01_0108286, partial [Trifolium medium]|nr:hypothetical protein [Trifolium medium]